jgi:hypothetical protein
MRNGPEPLPEEGEEAMEELGRKAVSSPEASYK